MKILFVVNAIHNWERIGILTLSSIIKQSGRDVQLYNIRGKSDERILNDISRFKPDVLAYSAMSTEIGPYLRVNRVIRQNLGNGMKSVFGGPHPTFFPGMITEDGVDAVCRGEAEESFSLYLEYLDGCRKRNQVPGFVLRDGGDFVENPIAALPCNLDGIPFPDRALWDPIDPHPTLKSFFASRGCPYQCSYCFNHRYNELYGHPKPIVRRRSVDNFIAEIRSVVNRYPEIHPFFDDDSFLLAPVEWLEEFGTRYLRDIGRPFGCNIRANQANERKVRLLAEAGWHYCWFGLECGDEEFANRVLHRNLTNEQIRQTARLLRSHGIRFVTQNLNALPSDNPLETDEKTLQLNIECRPDFAMAHIFYPFPGTELAAYSEEQGLFDGNYSQLNDVLCLKSPLQFPPKLKKELERQNKLFATVVVFPWLKPFLRLLRKLPLGKVYALAHFLCLGYCTRIKMMPGRKGLRFYGTLAALLLRRLAHAR
jgi:anaerobic magnesium-protoporphyrin IX monomethyl ester cyclase